METYLVAIIILGVTIWLSSRVSSLEAQVKILTNDILTTTARVTLIEAVAPPVGQETPAAPATRMGPPSAPRRTRAAFLARTFGVDAVAMPIVEELAPGAALALPMGLYVAKEVKRGGRSRGARWLARARITGERETFIGGN